MRRNGIGVSVYADYFFNINSAIGIVSLPKYPRV
jgi:hypothetical protein